MAIDSVIHTNQHSVDRVLNARLPVVLVFWNRESQAAAQMDPMLDHFAARYAGKALFAKIDATSEQALVQRYGIKQVPNLVFVKDGKAEATATGTIDEAALQSWLTYLEEGGARPPVPRGATDNGMSSGHAAHTNGRVYTKPSATNGAGMPVILTDANFAQMVNDTKPVLVDFWAPWCGPCHMVAPAVETLAREFQGKAVVGKLNVDENPRTAQQYSVMSIPTLFIFQNGTVVDQIAGAQPVHVLRQRLARFVA